MTRKFKEMALCHLPEDEIRFIDRAIKFQGLTKAYQNDGGFIISVSLDAKNCPILKGILYDAYLDWDGIIFDCAVEPDPELEVYP